MSPLFRDEVVVAQQAQYLGTIRIGRNPSFELVTLVGICLATALISFAYFGEVTRKARVTGLLMPLLGSLQLSATSAGVLVESRVREGEVVREGQVLFVLRTDHRTTSGDTAALISQNLLQRRGALETERRLRELQSRQRLQAISDSIRNTQAALRQAEKESELVQRRVALSAKSVERFRQLSDEGFVSGVQIQQKEEDFIDLQGRSQFAERTRLGLLRDLQTLKADLTATVTQTGTELALIDRNLAALTQEGTENDGRKQVAITAPQAGAVTGLTVNLGAAVQAGATLATLVPATRDGLSSELQALLFAPSRTAGFVQPGQAVLLRYAAYPYQKFGMALGMV